MKQAILFDVDDTLYDMRTPFWRAFEELFGTRFQNLDWKEVYVASRKHSDEVFEASQKGEMSMEDMYVYRWSKAMEDYGANIRREEALEFQRLYQGYQKQISMSETIQKMLTECVKAQIPLGVITNGPSAHQWNKTRALGLSRWIPDEAVIVSGDMDMMKPDPRIFFWAEKVLHSLGYQGGRKNCWFVGDTFSTDMAGALEAGWNTIWFNRRNHQTPEQKVDKIVKTEEELYQAIVSLIREQ